MAGGPTRVSDGQGKQPEPVSIPISDNPDAKKKVEEKELLKCFGDKWIGRKWNRIKLLFTKGVWVNNKEAKKLLGKLNSSQLEGMRNLFQTAHSSSGVRDSLVLDVHAEHSQAKEQVNVTKSFSNIVGSAKSLAEKAEQAVEDFATHNEELIMRTDEFSQFIADRGDIITATGSTPSGQLNWWATNQELLLADYEDHLIDKIKKGEMSADDIASHFTVNPDLLERSETSLRPSIDIHSMEFVETPDHQGATGRVETTSETDEHQLHGPRNDDNVSMTILGGGESIIVETDGAGSGGHGSAVLSYELNRNINRGLTENAIRLKSLAIKAEGETDPGTKKEMFAALEVEVKRIAEEALTEAKSAVLADKDITAHEMEAMQMATTLSVVMSVRVSDTKTMSFGLQNHDSVSVLFDPGQQGLSFDEQSYQTEDSHNQIKLEESVPFSENIDLSTFFHNEFEGERIALAFSDGVLDNLPGQSNRERLEILNDIILNPAFDNPVSVEDYDPGIVLTSDKIKKVGDGSRSEPTHLTPEIIRDRIMNFTFWASSGAREKQASTDPYVNAKAAAVRGEGALVNHISIEYGENVIITEDEKNALPESVQEKLEEDPGEGYKFTEETTVIAHALPISEFEKLPEMFREKVPSVTYPKDQTPVSVKKKLVSDYHDRKIINTDQEVVVFFDEKVFECIGPSFERAELEKVKESDPGAVTAKTDGVSVVATRVGARGGRSLRGA